MNVRQRFSFLLCLGLLFSMLGAGCTGEAIVQRTSDGGILITLVPTGTVGTTGTTGTITDNNDGVGGPALPPAGTGSTEPEPAAPPPPNSLATEPPSAPGSTTPPPEMSGNEKLQILRDTYGIIVSGTYGDHELNNLLLAAQQYRPEETATLNVYFAPGNTSRGIMGCYSPGSIGRMEIYDHNYFHTVHHELVHHITLYPRNRRARAIAMEVAQRTPPEQGSLLEADPRYIPSNYARVNTYEFWAEFFSHLREMEKGYRGGYPRSPYFNPPEDIRQIARQVYATP